MVQPARSVTHDFILTADEFNRLVVNDLKEVCQTKTKMIVTDEEYDLGDYCYFRHYENDELKWLAARTIVGIERAIKGLRTDECLLTLQ